MRHNDKLTFEQKTERTLNFLNESDLLNRLFFAGRNNAISYALYQIEDYFRAQGFNVVCNWKESSFQKATIEFVFKDKKQTHYRTCWLNRERELSGHNDLSHLMYSVDRVSSTEYSPYQLSAHLISFQNELASQSFLSLITDLVNGVNYPFGNEKMSYADKVEALKSIKASETTYSDMFETARSVTIFNALRTLQHDLDEAGFKVVVRPPVVNQDKGFITIELIKPNVSINLEFEQIKNEQISTSISQYMYKFTKVGSVSSSTSKARVLDDFIVYTSSQEFSTLVERSINGLNYPFMYDSLSSF